MTTRFLRLLSIGAGALALAGCGQKVQTFAPGPAPETPTPASYSLPSPLTGTEDMGFRIVFPPDYDETKPDQRFPVVYMLHGYGGNQSTFIEANVPQRALELMRAGTIQQMVLVFPSSGGMVPVPGTSFYTNSDFGQYESWFTDVLVPFVNRNFNVDSTRVGVSGQSMGGYGAMMLALRHPTMFRSVSVHSAPLSLISFSDPCMLARLATENSVVDGSGVRTYDSYLHFERISEATPLTAIAMSMSSAFTSHTGCTNDPASWDAQNTPGMHRYIVATLGPCPTDPSASLAIGFDFPLILNGDGTTTIVPDAWGRFLDNDPYTVLGRIAATNGPDYAAFAALRIYFDAGRFDDCDPTDDGAGFLIHEQSTRFHEELTALGIAHDWVSYEGAHENLVYYHIDDDLANHSAAFGASVLSAAPSSVRGRIAQVLRAG